MSFFRERNNIKNEYSGYQEISENLRAKLFAIVDHRAGYNIGLGNEDYFLQLEILDHEMQVHLVGKALEVIRKGDYSQVFEAIEIFLHCVRSNLFTQAYNETLVDILTAFRTSGCVYAPNQQGEIVLQISEDTAKNIKSAQEQMGGRSPEALDFFQRALSDLLSRGRNANDIIKDFAVSMEDYLKGVTGKKGFDEALRELRTQGILAATQEGVLTKLYAYRGDAHGVAHSGNTEEPKVVDAVWFLETFVAQVKMIEAKLKENVVLIGD